MTVEELKVEAAKLGYSIIKRTENFLPCICGHNKRTHGCIVVNKEADKQILFDTLTCKKCGFTVRYKSRLTYPKDAWNDAIRKEQKLQ